MNIALLADAALPLVWFTLPAVILLLIPTVLIEGFLLKFWLRIPTWQALKASLIANAASTIAGVPLATGLLIWQRGQ
jgi:Na+/phosphate symporter